MPRFATLAAAAVLLALLGAPRADASTISIVGDGPAWSSDLLLGWTYHVSDADRQVGYSMAGPSQAREEFAAGSADFALTDRPYNESDPLAGSTGSSTRPYAYVPIVGSGVTFAYDLHQNGQPITGVRLSPPTLARIFTGQITAWDDPAIARDNHGRALPAEPITTVVRADASGLNHLLTAWFAAEEPEVWHSFQEGGGPTSGYPSSPGQHRVTGADAMLATFSQPTGEGSIGYIETSQATPALQVAAVRNPAGYYVAPTSLAMSIALSAADVDGDDTDPGHPIADLTGVFGNTDPRSYPVTAPSYLILPTGTDAQDTTLSTPVRQGLADLVSYAACGGQPYEVPGYAALPQPLTQVALSQLALLQQADPSVDLTGDDLAHCANPAFHPSADSGYHGLGRDAPQPPSCAKEGSVPCGVTLPRIGSMAYVILGRRQAGHPLRVRVDVDPASASLAFRWTRDGHPIAGATARRYVLRRIDRRHHIRVRITARIPTDVLAAVANAGPIR